VVNWTSRLAWSWGVNSCQRGMAWASGVLGRGGGGLWCRFHRITSVNFLPGCEPLLTPACQLQEDLGRYYRMR
jgi:hypothetical protein